VYRVVSKFTGGTSETVMLCSGSYSGLKNKGRKSRLVEYTHFPSCWTVDLHGWRKCIRIVGTIHAQHPVDELPHPRQLLPALFSVSVPDSTLPVTSCNRTSCIHAVVPSLREGDTGRYGLHVLSRHFPHPVGRIRQNDVLSLI